MSPTSQVLSVGLLLVTIILSGHWLRRSGRPLNVAISALHKLVGVAVGVILVLTVRRVSQAAGLGAAELTASAVTGLLFLCLVASGGLLSSETPRSAAVKSTHRILPYLTVISTAVTLYVLLARR